MATLPHTTTGSRYTPIPEAGSCLWFDAVVPEGERTEYRLNLAKSVLAQVALFRSILLHERSVTLNAFLRFESIEYDIMFLMGTTEYESGNDEVPFFEMHLSSDTIRVITDTAKGQWENTVKRVFDIRGYVPEIDSILGAMPDSERPKVRA